MTQLLLSLDGLKKPPLFAKFFPYWLQPKIQCRAQVLEKSSVRVAAPQATPSVPRYYLQCLLCVETPHGRSWIAVSRKFCEITNVGDVVGVEYQLNRLYAQNQKIAAKRII
jgi:hypothetical protein